MFEWKLFPGHITLRLLREVQIMVEKEPNVLPRDFKDRIIFISIYSDIDWNQKDKEEICTRASSHANSACQQPDAPQPCVGLLRGSSQLACCMCPGRLVSALMFLDTQQVLESRQMAS